MRTNKITYILAIALALLFVLPAVHCKKYPENDKRYWSSRKKRILGKWEPVAFLINGIDSVTVLKSIAWYGPYHFIEDKKETINCFIVSDSAVYYAIQGNWGFQEHKKELSVSFDHSFFATTHYGPYGYKYGIAWEIRRLTNKELWLTVDYDNKNYYVKFNKL